jgi:hypothetical protein
MTTSKCPICGFNRTSKEHKQRSDNCGKEARKLGSGNSFIGAYKNKFNDSDVPKWSERSR